MVFLFCICKLTTNLQSTVWNTITIFSWTLFLDTYDVSTGQPHTTPPAPVQDSCGIYQTKQVIRTCSIIIYYLARGGGVHVCSVSNAVHNTRAFFYRRFGESCKITHEQVNQRRTDTEQGIGLGLDPIASCKCKAKSSMCIVINPQHACAEGYNS